tara:strand:- start:1088 stop:1591 length:504 start_codon:yes stop_codon:yes gene_type:complete
MSKTSSGKVISVNMSPEGGVPKYPQPQVFIDQYGISEDYHSGEINKHLKCGATEPNVPNSRPISIVSLEVLNEVSTLLGIDLKPGDLAENITIDKLGDLSDLVEGDNIQIGKEVVLQVSGQNKPCGILNVYHESVVKSLVSKRGITATVIKTGIVKPEDNCHIIKGK